MNIINTSCFKHDNKSYVICFGSLKNNVNLAKEIMTTLKCTNEDGSTIDIKLQHRENLIIIEMEKGHSDIINIKTSKQEFKNVVLHFPFENAFEGFNISDYDLTYTLRSTGTYMEDQKDRKELVIRNY